LPLERIVEPPLPFSLLREERIVKPPPPSTFLWREEAYFPTTMIKITKELGISSRPLPLLLNYLAYFCIVRVVHLFQLELLYFFDGA
jgi:hypothetical protein